VPSTQPVPHQQAGNSEARGYLRPRLELNEGGRPLKRHETPDPVRSNAMYVRFHGVERAPPGQDRLAT
jgi:hypothetical protein